VFGQSYHLFGQNSFRWAAPQYWHRQRLDTSRSDYVASASYQPSSILTLTSRFRLGEKRFHPAADRARSQRQFRPLDDQDNYGNYAPQPALGYLDRREGILPFARFKVNPNWLLLGACDTTCGPSRFRTQIGVGYSTDCLILALNSLAEYVGRGRIARPEQQPVRVDLDLAKARCSRRSRYPSGAGA